jgi:hypothetical protein
MKTTRLKPTSSISPKVDWDKRILSGEFECELNRRLMEEVDPVNESALSQNGRFDVSF